MIRFLPIPAILLNGRLALLEASRAAYALFRIPHATGPDEVHLRELARFLEHEDGLVQRIREATRSLPSPGASALSEWASGERVFTLTVGRMPDEEADARYGIVFEETTRQHLWQRDAARIRCYLEGVMASLHHGVIVADRSFRITHMNQAQEMLMKDTGRDITALEALGMPLPELFPDESALLEEAARRVIGAGETRAGILQTRGSGPQERFHTLGFSPLRDEQGLITGLIRVCEDITEKQQAENTLRQAEIQQREMAVIRNLVVTLKHNINNALTTILSGAATLVILEPDLSEPTTNMLSAIHDAGKRIEILTEKLDALECIRSIPYLDDGTDMIEI